MMALLICNTTHNVSDLPIQDAEMMEQIDRDVMRTHPDMHFFSGEGESSKQHREVCNTLIRTLCQN